MKKMIIEGGRPLVGNIRVSGSKNAALPIIFATLITSGVSEIENLANIADVRVAIEIIRALGARVDLSGGRLIIDTRSLSYTPPPPELVSKIRASSYLIGGCVGRFLRFDLQPFGGCSFSGRPIDLHLLALRRFGCSVDRGSVEVKRLVGGYLKLPFPSVGATVNSILLAASAEGDSLIEGCAIEPHIDQLIDFLRSAGGDISREGRSVSVHPRRLHGGNIRIRPDMIEAGSYLAASLISGGDIRLADCPFGDMEAVFSAFSKLGAELFCDRVGVGISMREQRPATLVCEPYPGLATDLQPIFAVLMARFSGGEIVDRVFPERFGYLGKLSSFGIESKIADGRAEVFRSKIQASRADCSDLRGGFALLLAALAAEGRSEISSADLILRGYEAPIEKMRSLGAEIKLIPDK